MSTQPGYDDLAAAYDELFPQGYVSAAERHALALYADDLLTAGPAGPVADVGCGAGHITHDLASRGLEVVGLDPSTGMLELAARHYPALRWVSGDATLQALPDDHPRLAGVVARFSLIHVEPVSLPGVLTAWAGRLRPGAHVLVAFQCSDAADSPVLEFDHTVARAWRWHPDAMAATLRDAGFAERWRLVVQADESYRFATCHLVAALPA